MWSLMNKLKDFQIDQKIVTRQKQFYLSLVMIKVSRETNCVDSIFLA